MKPHEVCTHNNVATEVKTRSKTNEMIKCASLDNHQSVQSEDTKEAVRYDNADLVSFQISN